jgi:hypothetical protein
MAKEFTRRIKEDLIYIPKAYVEDEKPLTFTFKTLSNKEISQIDDKLSAYNIFDNKIITATNELNLTIALDKITGWDNIIIDGENIKFDSYLLDELNIVDELVELGNYIYIVSKYPETRIEY